MGKDYRRHLSLSSTNALGGYADNIKERFPSCKVKAENGGLVARQKKTTSEANPFEVDARVCPEEEADLWKEHKITINNIDVIDLPLLLVTKMRAAATRREWQQIKVRSDLSDVSFCAEKLSEGGNVVPSEMMGIISETKQLFAAKLEKFSSYIDVPALHANLLAVGIQLE